MSRVAPDWDEPLAEGERADFVVGTPWSTAQVGLVFEHRDGLYCFHTSDALGTAVFVDSGVGIRGHGKRYEYLSVDDQVFVAGDAISAEQRDCIG